MSTPDLNLTPDLQTGVVPISSAASQLAILIKRATATQRPIVITQKGYPSGVLLSIDVFDRLRALVEGRPLTPPPPVED
jgi:prevent-host-death family protein